MAKTVSEFECVAVKSAFTEDHGCGLTCEHARAQSARALKTTPSCGLYRTGLYLELYLVPVAIYYM